MKKINWYLKERLPESLSGITAIILSISFFFLKDSGHALTIGLLIFMAIIVLCGYRTAKDHWFPEKKKEQLVEDPTHEAFQCEYDGYHPH